MDGIPVMSRAACRNHAVRTLGCVNQMACVVTYGKGDHAMARNARIRDGRGIRPPSHRRIPVWRHARNHCSNDAIVAYLPLRFGSVPCNLASTLPLIDDRYSDRRSIFSARIIAVVSHARTGNRVDEFALKFNFN